MPSETQAVLNKADTVCSCRYWSKRARIGFSKPFHSIWNTKHPCSSPNGSWFSPDIASSTLFQQQNHHKYFPKSRVYIVASSVTPQRSIALLPLFTAHASCVCVWRDLRRKNTSCRSQNTIPPHMPKLLRRKLRRKWREQVAIIS